ncbi:MAG: hypothetical protein AB7V32_00680 [Candidatus Berkiella sp.]
MNIGPSLRLRTVLKDDPNLRGYDGNISPNFDAIYPQKPHVMMGFGFVSGTDGLSVGLPLDALTMVLNGLKVAQALGPQSKVVIIVADQQALSCEHLSCADKAKVVAMGNKYVKKLNYLIDNLKARDKITILRSSEITSEPKYQGLLLAVQRRQQTTKEPSTDTQEIITQSNRYTGSHLQYFTEQTVLVQYLYDVLNCGLKLGWTRYTKAGDIRKSTSMCEAHFDRFYLDLFSDDNSKLSFVYSVPGYNLKKDAAQNGRVIPYTAPLKQGLIRLLCKRKQPIPEDVETANCEFFQAMKLNAKYLRQRLGLASNEQNNIRIDIAQLRDVCRNPAKLLTLQFESITMLKSGDEPATTQTTSSNVVIIGKKHE